MDHFLNFEPQSDPDMRLFCFPYAGGSAAGFRGFADGLSPHMEVWAVNMPGHGSRLHETSLVDLKQAAFLLAAALAPLSDRPFAFFGYSLGARLAFETARLLRAGGQKMPLHFYAAVAPAPQLPQAGRLWHRLPDDALMAELRRYNGLPQELLDEPQLLALLIPALRADLQMYETAEYGHERPFDFPITVFGGNRDPLVDVKELDAWRDQTTGQFRLALFDGDHFFLRGALSAVLQSIAQAKLGTI